MAPLTDVVIFTIVVEEKKLLAWGLLTRLLSDSDTRFDSESVAKDPPPKKMLQKIGTPQQTNGGSYNPGLTPNIFS